MDNNIKQDINFLENPIWMQKSKIGSDKIYKFKDKKGYTFEASGGIPSKVDQLFLYFLMLESQNNEWNNEIIISQYKVLKSCGINPSITKRKRLIESLKKWKRVTISFEGTFCIGKKRYTDAEFGIIETSKINIETNKLEITFNKDYLEKIRESEFFKYVSFEQLKALRSSLTRRLYEILGKSFYSSNTFEIDAFKLANKIPMSDKYLSAIIQKIEAATRKINEKTDLKITVSVKKKERGQGKFIFRKSRSYTNKLPHKPKSTTELNEKALEEHRNFPLDSIKIMADAGNLYAIHVLEEKNKE